MQLLNNRFAPITFRIGFVRASLDDLFQEYVRWQHSILRVVSRELIDGTLDHKLDTILPLDDAGERVLFTATQSDWVAVLDNKFRGTNVNTVVAVISERVAADPGLVITDVPNSFKKGKSHYEQGFWGKLSLSAYGTQKDTGVWGTTRTVSLSNDVSGWEFQQLGTPWKFEHMSRYNIQPVTARLDSELLLEYLLKFGIKADEEEFYSGLGFATRSRFPLNLSAKTFDIRQIQKQIGVRDS